MNGVGVILVIIGVTWVLQGMSVLPGSFMTGQSKWAVYGAVTALVGITLLIAANRRRTKR